MDPSYSENLRKLLTKNHSPSTRKPNRIWRKQNKNSLIHWRKSLNVICGPAPYSFQRCLRFFRLHFFRLAFFYVRKPNKPITARGKCSISIAKHHLLHTMHECSMCHVPCATQFFEISRTTMQWNGGQKATYLYEQMHRISWCIYLHNGFCCTCYVKIKLFIWLLTSQANTT